MTRRLILALAPLALAPQAHAACKSMNGETFDKYVADAEEAIDNDDLVRHGSVFRAMQDQLPCMDEQLPAESWAQFLVGYSVVEFAMGREWEHALDVALGIKPTIGRDYGPPEVRNYVPTARYEDETQPKLPEDAEIYLDGKRIQHEPGKLDGLHIVQQLKAGVWNTRVLMNEPFPEDWKVQFVDEPVDEEPVPLQASIYLLGGFAAGGQLVTEGQASGPIDDITGGGALISVGTYGTYMPGGPVGMFWDLSGPFRIGEGPGVEAYVGPALGIGDLLSIQPGVGVGSVTISDIDGSRPAILPQAHLGAQLTTPMGPSTSMELGAGAGAAFSGWHGRGRWGVTGGDGLGWNGGLEFSVFTGFFEEQGSARRVSASAYRVGLRGGIAFR